MAVRKCISQFVSSLVQSHELLAFCRLLALDAMSYLILSLLLHIDCWQQPAPSDVGPAPSGLAVLRDGGEGTDKAVLRLQLRLGLLPLEGELAHAGLVLGWG